MGNIEFGLIAILATVFFLCINIYCKLHCEGPFLSYDSFLCFMIIVILIVPSIFNRKSVDKRTAKLRRLSGIILLLILIITAYWGKLVPPAYNPFLFLGLGGFFIYLVIFGYNDGLI